VVELVELAMMTCGRRRWVVVVGEAATRRMRNSCPLFVGGGGGEVALVSVCVCVCVCVLAVCHSCVDARVVELRSYVGLKSGWCFDSRSQIVK
jgi:hypothetical protein